MLLHFENEQHCLTSFPIKRMFQCTFLAPVCTSLEIPSKMNKPIVFLG